MQVKEVEVARDFPVNLRKGDEKLFESALKSSFYVLPVITLENVAILQDTVFSLQERRFYSEYTHVNGLSTLPHAKRILHCSLRKWRKVEEAIWIKDEWSANYFHWLTDCLPRIWDGMQNSSCRKILLMDSYRHLPFVTESLQLLGLEAEYYQSAENLWVKKLILTARTATFPNFSLDHTRVTRDRLRISSSPPPYRKIYISRRFATKRKSTNSKDVERLVTKYGFEVVYAEKLSLKKQIKLMSETTVLVSPWGNAHKYAFPP
ncbi:glycosyltransferase family 61 protein [Algoriphagus namhaensis]